MYNQPFRRAQNRLYDPIERGERESSRSNATLHATIHATLHARYGGGKAHHVCLGVPRELANFGLVAHLLQRKLHVSVQLLVDPLQRAFRQPIRRVHRVIRLRNGESVGNGRNRNESHVIT
eukprot:3777393-Pyramimonas_sp.AAC.1